MTKRIVCWFSCGAASAVATKLAMAENRKGDNLPLVIAYTEIKEEHPDNKRFLKDCEKWFGQEVVILKNEFYDGSIYNVFKKNYMRTPHGSPCTRALKKQVRYKFERPTDRQVFGYTLEEQNRVDRFIDANKDVDLWDILIEKQLTKNDTLAIIINAGIELPVMYKLGYKNNNCIGCVKGGIGYWNKIRVDFPDQFDRMARLERLKGCTVLKESRDATPIYLDELDPKRGHYPSEPDMSCGIFCKMAEDDFK